MTNSESKAQKVIIGVDTHTYVHVAVAIDTRGTRLGDHAFVANAGGCRALIRWADTHGRVEACGVEGTGSYGAGLTWAVRRAGHRGVEVNRGDRRTRRTAGTSDTALLHESSLARTMPTDRILTGRCDMTLVGRGRSSDSRSHSRGRPHSPAQLDSGREDHLR